LAKRANALKLPTAFRHARVRRTIAVPVHDPEAYAIICEGNCLAPLIRDGETVVLSPSTKVEKAMIVVMNFKDGRQSKIKRLADDPPRPPQAADEVEFLWMLEMDNPRRPFFVLQEDVESVHAVAGVLRDGKWLPLIPAA